MDYRVELDVYNGPLDLLLYLLKRDELDIYDIPIARITDSYMTYVQMLKDAHSRDGLDINVAGDFLVMAATLMEIKSAMLLPPPVAASGDNAVSAAAELTDPRYELVQKLLEYKRFKDAAGALEQQQALHRDRFARRPPPLGGADEPPPIDLEEVQIWDLLEAFTRLMAEVGRVGRQHEVIYDDTPIDLHAADIVDRLGREGHLTLRQLMEGRSSRSEMIGVFLAMLELIRQRRVSVRQNENLGDIDIVPVAPVQAVARDEDEPHDQPQRLPIASGDAHPSLATPDASVAASPSSPDSPPLRPPTPDLDHDAISH